MNVILTQYDGMILGPIAKVLGYILQGIYSFFDLFGIHNAGLCIILFTFIVNALIIPITIKQQKFSKLNSVITPEIQAIQAKYKGKKDQESMQKMQMEQNAVYSRYGVSPMAGCLPMLITLPLFFALYRVIYNIPAYVPQIKEIYENIINTVSTSGISIETFTHNLAAFVNKSGITDVNITSSLITTQSLSGVDDIVAAISSVTADGSFTAAASNYIVDILSQFRLENWKELLSMDMLKSYPAITDSINSSYKELTSIYSFLYMNIMEAPKFNNITIIIPVLAVVTQFINNKVIMNPNAGNASNNNNQNTTMQSMNAMNNIMPFVSGAFCFMFPIGVGLYWVAGNIFRTVQGLFINMYFNKVGLDSLIEKNREKQAKKQEKKGIDVNSTRMQEITRQKTSSVSSIAKPAANSSKKNTSGSSKNSKNFYVNKNIKNGSISDFANMLNRDYGESNDIESEDSSDE